MMLDSALGGTPEPDDNSLRTDGTPGLARIVELQDQVRKLKNELADERHRHEVEQERHTRNEQARVEELHAEQRHRIDIGRKNKRLKKRVNRLHKELTLLRGVSSAADPLREQVISLKADVRRLEAERVRRAKIWRRLAGALAALAGLLVATVPWATGLISGTLPIVLDGVGGAWLLAGAAVLVCGSRAVGVCCALIGALASTATTIIAADTPTQKSQVPAISQPSSTNSSRPATSGTTQSPRKSTQTKRQTRDKPR
jgi:hypothetical protein